MMQDFFLAFSDAGCYLCIQPCIPSANERRHLLRTASRMMKKKLVVSTGAGISAESGITTFRDAGGLWEQYPVMDVASATGFRRNPALIHKFYNERRHQLLEAQPNAAHLALHELEKYYDVYVITQNVDDLHERAGSSKVVHLHGELMNCDYRQDFHCHRHR